MATKGPRISNDALLRAGLDLMRQDGKPLTKMPSHGRSMLFKLASGETVRARTCNDHILIALAESADIESKMNIEGTDYLLIIMPKEERTHGKVIAYLVPTEEAASEARRTHQLWRKNTGRIDSNNHTRNLWFGDGKGEANGYAQKWKNHEIKGDASTLDHVEEGVTGSGENRTLTATIGKAQREIANAAGVAPEAVKISIDFAVQP